MKTVLLVRHAEPLKHTGLPTEQIPLSENGCQMARQFLHSRLFQDVCCTYTSPYRRARETAAYLPGHATPDTRLAERALGDPATLGPGSTPTWTTKKPAANPCGRRATAWPLLCRSFLPKWTRAGRQRL